MRIVNNNSKVKVESSEICGYGIIYFLKTHTLYWFLLSLKHLLSQVSFFSRAFHVFSVLQVFDGPERIQLNKLVLN